MEYFLISLFLCILLHFPTRPTGCGGGKGAKGGAGAVKEDGSAAGNKRGRVKEEDTRKGSGEKKAKQKT